MQRDYIQEFLEFRRAENAAQNTIRAYNADFEQLRSFVGGADWATKLSRTVIRGFMAFSNRQAESFAFIRTQAVKR